MSLLKRLTNRFSRSKRADLEQESKKSHIMITGTGRAGTTYLVHLLTALGFDTGFELAEIHKSINENAKAGLEWDVRAPDAPFICKSPWFSEYAREVLDHNKLEQIIIPVRDLRDAAESRIRVTRLHRETIDPNATKDIHGGLVFTEKYEDQQTQLQEQFFRLIKILADYNVPVTFISFPRFAKDPEYLYQKLDFLLKPISKEEFLLVYHQITRPEYIHTFPQVS